MTAHLTGTCLHMDNENDALKEVLKMRVDVLQNHTLEGTKDTHGDRFGYAEKHCAACKFLFEARLYIRR